MCVSWSGGDCQQTKRWSDLISDFEPNVSVRLELLPGGVRQGRSVSIDEESLVVRLGAPPDTLRFARAALESVKMKVSSEQYWGMLGGAVAGGAAMAALNDRGDVLWPFGAVFGALGGFVLGREIPRYESYSADGPEPTGNSTHPPSGPERALPPASPSSPSVTR
jgi:hypothetical protein